MRGPWLCLILSQCFWVGSALAQKARSPERELLQKFDACDRGLKQLGSQINKGASCENGEVVKKQSELSINSLVDEFSASNPSGPLSAKPERKPAADETSKKITYPIEKFKDLNGNEMPLSVLTPEQARALHKEMLGLGHEMRFNVPDSGCAARALIMGMEMKARGVESGKFWIVPGMFALGLKPQLNDEPQRYERRWSFHVTPFVLVKGADGKAEPYVIDPSVQKAGPISLEEYKKRMSDGALDVQASNRFPYTPADRFKKMTNYTESAGARARGELGNVVKDLRGGRRGIDSTH